MRKKKEKQPYSFFGNLRYIVREQWHFRKSYLFSVVAISPLEAAASVIAAFLPKVVLDCIERHVSPGVLIARVGAMSLVVVLLGILRVLFNAYTNKCRQSTVFCHWSPMHSEKTMDMDYHLFSRNRTRVLREKASDAIGTGPGNFLPYTQQLAAALFGFSAFTAIIVRCSFWFIPILIACYALSLVGWRLQQKLRDKLKDARAAATLHVRYVSSRAKDFSAAKDVRIYGMQDMLSNKSQKSLQESMELSDREARGFMYNVILEDVLKFAVSIGAYAYLIRLKLTTDMSLGDFSLYLGAITGFGAWLGRLADMYSDLLESSHAVGDYRAFLDLQDTMRKTGGAPLPDGTDVPCRIEFDHVTFAYDEAKKPILADFSLTIEPGERLAIVGENGAGKSTLVKLLCGLLLPQSGTIRVAGRDIRDFDRDAYYTMLSTVFQTVVILPTSVAKNIALCEEDRIDRARLEKCMRLANIYDKVQSLPDKENTLMVPEIHEGGVSLSGGEVQRLLLARALYKESASILILDEPTAALDPIAENDLYMQYSAFADGKTSVYISHRLSSTRFCDRVVLLENGRAAEIGTHAQLMAQNGAYAAMYRLQSRYYEKEKAGETA